MYMSIKTLDYVIFSHQANLSKTTKHWDGFVSHCRLGSQKLGGLLFLLAGFPVVCCSLGICLCWISLFCVSMS